MFTGRLDFLHHCLVLRWLDVVVIHECFEQLDARFCLVSLHVDDLESSCVCDRVCAEIPKVPDHIHDIVAIKL